MKQKHYSFLDQRRTDFDVDYDEFCKSTAELHVSENKCSLSWENVKKFTQHITIVEIYFHIFESRTQNGWWFLLFFLQFSVFLPRTSLRGSWTAHLKKYRTLKEPSMCWRSLKGKYFPINFNFVSSAFKLIFGTESPICLEKFIEMFSTGVAFPLKIAVLHWLKLL